MTRTSALALFVLVVIGRMAALAAAAPSNENSSAAAPPNIVLIISDDQGWGDFSFMGHPHIKTPNIDRLANESLTFTHGYVPSSLCCPSLASIITGLYPHEHKVTSNDPVAPQGMKLAEFRKSAAFREGREIMNRHLEAAPTLPRLLAQDGYVSLQTGKWWQGNYRRGGFTDGMTKGERHGDVGLEIGRQTMQPIYDFMATAEKDKKPFFVWYAPMMPHAPHNPPQRLLDKYAHVAPTLKVAQYCGMVEWFDETVGALLKHLDEQKLSDNTIVIFVTDNGWITDPKTGSYAPKSKQTQYDGGVRTPIMVRWPGHVKPQRSDALASSLDIAPTVLVAAKLQPTAQMRGVNLLDPQAVADRKSLFGECFTHESMEPNNPAASLKWRWMIEGKWKLIVPDKHNRPKDKVELYDLAADPREEHNLASSHGGVVQKMRVALDSWWNDRPAESFAQPATDKAPGNIKKFDFELQVVGPDGKPVPQAKVDIRTGPAVTQEQIKRGEFVRRYSYGTLAKADASGHLVLSFPKQPKSLSLGIETPGFGPYWGNWDATNHPQKIPAKFVAELEAGWTVGGVVVDGDGKPVEGAKIHPSIEFKKRPGVTQQLGIGTTMKTDAAGKWSFPSVPASMSEVDVEIMHPDFMPSGRGLTRAAYGIEAGREPAEKIVLDRGLTITGKVVDDSGKPIAGALVRTKFLNDVRQTKTDGDGSYRLGGCQAKMARVVVSANGRAMELKEVRVEPEMAPVDFTLKPGGKIRIRVVDKQGNGIPKSRIFFQQWRGPISYFEFDHVNGYANDQGVWEWNEAPLDSIAADICPPGDMQLSKQSIIARDEEYVFRPPTALVVTGTVVDAETKQPIKAFRVVPGIRSSDSHIDWVRQESYSAKDGKYRIRQGRSYPGHLVRIEADGYRAAVSEDIKSDEENVIVDFELEKGVNIAATILTPEGAPAAGAKAVLDVPKSQISIQNGSIDDGQTYAARVDADASGKFHFPPQNSQFRLIITHPTGFASIQSGPDWSRSRIKLTPWARVEGIFRAGKEIGANVGIELLENALDSYGADAPHVFTGHYTTTGPDGRFVFERVIPGDGWIGRRIILMVTDGATEVTSSKRMPIQCKAGETTKFQLGGDGRAVIGQLTPPKEFRDKVLWNFAMVHMKVEVPQLNSPPVPAAVENDPIKYQAWWNEWQLTPEGRAYRVMSETNEQIRKKSPYISASVDRDGAFRIDDVPPGNYVMSVRFDQHAAGRLQNYRVSVPAIEAGQTDEPLDLGVVTLTPN